MLRRIAVVAAACAAIVPFTAGSASASCLDDLQAADLSSDEEFSGSDHWLNWVHVQGTATVTVEGDDLIYDIGEVVRLNVARTMDTSSAAADATTAFVDCVAG